MWFLEWHYMKAKESHNLTSMYFLELPKKYGLIQTKLPLVLFLAIWRLLVKYPFKKPHGFQIMYIFERAVTIDYWKLRLIFSWPGMCDQLCHVHRRIIIWRAWYHDLGEFEFIPYEGPLVGWEDWYLKKWIDHFHSFWNEQFS